MICSGPAFPSIPCMTKRMRDYRDLVAWQQAIELALDCGRVADALPRRDWESASQLRRAAKSVHLNIAEGNGRPTTADYLKFLGNARASLNEVNSELHFLRRRYPSVTCIAPALHRVICVAKPLGGLVTSLERRRDRERGRRWNGQGE